MSKEKKPLFHIVSHTDADERREREELIKNLSEDKKSEFVFKGEDLYYIGGGHAWLYGFFDEYITKSGIKAWGYHSGKWSIEGNEYEYVDGEFIFIPPPPPSEPVDFSSIQLPIVKNVSAKTLSDDLLPIKPIDKP